jgi:Sec-independent protein translocase protein TatA
LQSTHLLFVLLAALVTGGPKHPVEMSRGTGQTIQRFQEYKEELGEELATPLSKDEPEKEFTFVSSSEKKG